MPDIVNDDELSSLAAEYVLGTLDANERTRANVLLDVDHQFLSLVRIWERRLGELHLMVEPVEPDTKIWTRIRGKLKNVAPIAVAPAPVQAPPPPPVPKMPSAAPFPAPMEPKPAPAAGHRLAGLFQEVEKLTADTKLAEHKAEPKVAESGVVDSRAAESRVADPQFKEQKADPKLAEQKIVEVKPGEPTLAPLTEPDPMVADTPPAGPEEVVAEPQRPRQPVQPAPSAELRPLNMSTVVFEPRPTVAELAAKLAPDPVVPTPDDPRPVDRIRRDSSTTSLPDSGRKKAVRSTVNRIGGRRALESGAASPP